MGIQEIISEISRRLVGYLTDLKTVAKDSIVSAINELVGEFNSKLIFGDRNQALVPKSDNSSDYEPIDIVVRGAFVTTDDELAAAKLISVSPSTVYSTWKRFSHGGGTYGSGSPVLSNTIPGIPLETNSWSYNSGTDAINSTVNSASHIGFRSDEKYGSYIHSLTLSATDTDNDFIATVIAYVEDGNDMVANNAYGLNPSDFSWPIDVTSPTIPNQHTITLVRGRSNQANHPFAVNARYAIVYDMGKLTQQILVNGELSGVWNTTNSFSGSPQVDVKVVRSGDLVETYTTDWSDAPSGKGALRFKLSYDLSSLDITNKFRGAASYGFSAISQRNSTFINDFFNRNINRIYDVRNGDKWVANSAGTYTLSSTETLYTDYGERRLFFDNVTKKLIEVWPDKTWDLMSASLRFGIEDNTSDVDRLVNMQQHQLQVNNISTLDFVSGDENSGYAEISSLATTGENGGGTIDLFAASNDLHSNAHINADGSSGLQLSYYDYPTRTTSAVIMSHDGLSFRNSIASDDHINMYFKFGTRAGTQPQFIIPISVNGITADATGNITVSTGGGGTSTTLSDSLTTTSTGTALDAHQGYVLKGLIDAKGDMLLSKWVVDEVLSGTVNGVNTVFTFANPVTTGTQMVFLNGTKQKRGTDYTMTNSTTATFTTAPITDTDGTDYLEATYFKQ